MPAAQSEHTTDPRSAFLPAGHGRQSAMLVLASTAVEVFAGQAEQSMVEEKPA